MNCLKSAYGDDPNQFGELRIPDGAGPYPVVFFIHGGFWRATWDLTNAHPFCFALNEVGFATWSIEYRRIGQPGGGYPGTTEDVRKSAGHLRTLADEYGLDPGRVVLAGHSAGGHLALWLAAQEAIGLRGVVSLAGVTDLRRAFELRLSNGVVGDFMGGSPEEVGERYAAASPRELLPIGTPQVLVHGTADDTVPFELSESFVEASENARLVTLPDAGHRELIHPGGAEWSVVLGVLRELAES